MAIGETSYTNAVVLFHHLVSRWLSIDPKEKKIKMLKIIYIYIYNELLFYIDKMACDV